MPVPRSVVVMSVLTAIPFGLAIRDTVKGNGHVASASEREEAAERESEAAYRAQIEAEERASEERRARAAKQLDGIYGATPASFGTLLAGATFDEALPDELVNRPEISGVVSIFSDFDEASHHASGVTVSVHDDSLCDQLRAKLVAAWGPPTYDVWLAADQTQRAQLEDCRLTFQRALPITAWLEHLDLLGQSETSLRTRLGDDSLGDPEWTIPGIGYGGHSTTVDATLDRGKVTFVSAMTEADFDTRTQLRDAISKKLGSPVRDEETNDWVWKKKPTARLSDPTDDNFFVLTFGKETTP